MSWGLIFTGDSVENCKLNKHTFHICTKIEVLQMIGQMKLHRCNLKLDGYSVHV
jgi:hypothetical protein